MNNEKWNDPYYCFWELYNSWGRDEQRQYCETFEHDWKAIDYEPCRIPTKNLQPSHYKCLRVLEDYFETHFNGEE